MKASYCYAISWFERTWRMAKLFADLIFYCLSDLAKLHFCVIYKGDTAMPTATLRSVGGSIVMVIPKRILELVQLQAGSRVDIDVQQGQLIVIPQRRKRYTLSELLAQCNSSLPLTDGEREWLDVPAIGLEYGAAGQ